MLTKNPNFKPVSKTSSTALTDINSPREVVVLDEVPTPNQNAQRKVAIVIFGHFSHFLVILGHF